MYIYLYISISVVRNVRIASVKHSDLLLLSREVWEDPRKWILVDNIWFNIAFFFLWNNHPLVILWVWTYSESAQTAQNTETQDRDSEKHNTRQTTHSKQTLQTNDLNWLTLCREQGHASTTPLITCQTYLYLLNSSCSFLQDRLCFLLSCTPASVLKVRLYFLWLHLPLDQLNIDHELQINLSDSCNHLFESDSPPVTSCIWHNLRSTLTEATSTLLYFKTQNFCLFCFCFFPTLLQRRGVLKITVIFKSCW